MVLLSPEARLTDGAKVRVEPVEESVPTLEQMLAPLAGKATGLPSAMAENHERYLHGSPKRRRP